MLQSLKGTDHSDISSTYGHVKERKWNIEHSMAATPDCFKINLPISFVIHFENVKKPLDVTTIKFDKSL